MTDDELRDELAEAICENWDHGVHSVATRLLHRREAEAVLPVVRQFADAQVAAERERIAKALEELDNGLRLAVRIVRAQP